MELTTEQALQQGVTAHQEGKLQDAERLYRAILQSQPAHPDANHNLGLIAVSCGKADAALNANQTSVALSPQDAEAHCVFAWMTYLNDVDIKDGHSTFSVIMV